MYAGKSLNNKDQSASIKGAIAFAMHARLMAEQYGVVAIVHSDHCAYVNVSSFQCDATFFSLLPLSFTPPSSTAHCCAVYPGSSFSLVVNLSLAFVVVLPRRPTTSNPLIFTNISLLPRIFFFFFFFLPSYKQRKAPTMV